MRSAVCTLFEGNYHYGVAMLTNSLSKNGFSGSIYVGYRGELPDWCSRAELDQSLQWLDGRTLTINDKIKLHFLPVITSHHLAHTKPNFMLRLWNGPAKEATSITYFDPDIVIKCNWTFYEKWMNHGVALVHEIVMNDMPATHPIRKEWENIICDAGKSIEQKITSYLNSGFCGVSTKYFSFIQLWDEIIQLSIDKYKQDPTLFATNDRTSAFWNIDQDCFNIAAMCSTVPISEVGPEGMDFIHGGRIMSHAANSAKPWKKKYIKAAIKGIPPTLADKAYWSYVGGPIKMYSPFYIKLILLSLQIAGFIGRFYKRI